MVAVETIDVDRVEVEAMAEEAVIEMFIDEEDELPVGCDIDVVIVVLPKVGTAEVDELVPIVELDEEQTPNCDIQPGPEYAVSFDGPQ